MQSDSAPSPQHFWRQEAAFKALAEAKDRGRLARSYLFTGPTGAGKWAAAQWLAKVLLCEQAEAGNRPCLICSACRRIDQGTHLDWHALLPLPKATAEDDRVAFLKAKAADPFAVVSFAKKPNLAIDWVRDLLAELSKTSVEGGAKVSVIASADQMTLDGQTVLLKSIEEPPLDTYFILTSSDPARILPTVRSRCQTIRFAPVDPGAIASRLIEMELTDPEDAALIAQLCGGGWGQAVRLADEKLKAWRQTVSSLWNEAFMGSPGSLIAEIDRSFSKNRAFDEVVQAFDVWGLLLRRDCADSVTDHKRPNAASGMPVLDMDTAWACWRILQNGRATLYVNVMPRSAVKGTFLALRRRLGCQ